jgi:hypothetical protein
VRNRRIFLLALLLVVFGLFAHLTALRYAAHSARLTGQAMAVPADSFQLRAERDFANHHANLALIIGVACALLGAFFTFLSYRVDESAPRLVIVVLLLFYGVLHFAVV